MLVELPNGFIDGQDHFDHVLIDELRGKQQNYLADQELVVGNIGHVPKILEDMILSVRTKDGLEWKGSIKDLVWKLPSGDLEAILIKIRENTFGTRFYFETQCTKCGHNNKNLRLNLNELKITKLPIEELLDNKKRTVLLPKSQIEVELKPLHLKDLFDSIKITREKPHSIVTAFLRLAVKRLGDKTNIEESDIENLPLTDLTFLNKEAEKIKLEGNIDTTIEHTCSKCNQEFQSQLNCFEASFFDPTRGL